MNPFIENLIISLCTGLATASTLVTQLDTSASRDWVVIIAAFISAFAGSLINGLRQLQKEPRP